MHFMNNLHTFYRRQVAGKSSGVLHPLNMPVPKNYKGDLVPKIVVEEKEQELLSKDETIQVRIVTSSIVETLQR